MLLDELSGIQVEKTTFEEAREKLRRWPSLRGPCDRNDCAFLIDVPDPLVEWVLRLARYSAGDLNPFDHPTRFFVPLGACPAELHGYVRVKDGKVSSKRLTFWLSVPPTNREQWPEQFLAGFASVSRHLLSSGDGNIKNAVQNARLHPDYLLGYKPTYPNADYGGGILAPSIWLEFSALADTLEVSRLTQFDLSCFTRWWRACLIGDLMPAAFQQFQRDEERRKGHQMAACTAEIASRLDYIADNIVVAKVQADELHKQQDGSFRMVSLRLLRRLRGATFWEAGTIRDLWVARPDDPSLDDGLARQIPGADIIVMFNRDRHPNRHPSEFILPCGVIPSNAQNLKLLDTFAPQY